VVTEQWVAGVMAAILALVLELVPQVKARWEGMSWEAKRFAWLVGCVTVGATPFVLGCVAGRLGIEAGSAAIVGSCTVDTLAKGMQIGFLAYFASQAVHGAAHGVQQLTGSKEGDGV
jgi:hypothetical protein